MLNRRIAPLVAIAVALSVATSVQAQILIAPAFLYVHNVKTKRDSSSFWEFTPAAAPRDLPSQCMRFIDPMPDLPTVLLYGPSYESRTLAMFVWTDQDQRILRTQIIHHRDPLPIQDPATNTSVIDPMTPLTPHTVVLVDFADTSFVAYNVIGEEVSEGIETRLGTYPTNSLMRATIAQLAAAKRVCKLKSRDDP